MKQLMIIVVCLGSFFTCSAQLSQLDSADFYMAKGDTLFILVGDNEQAIFYYKKANLIYKEKKRPYKFFITKSAELTYLLDKGLTTSQDFYDLLAYAKQHHIQEAYLLIPIYYQLSVQYSITNQQDSMRFCMKQVQGLFPTYQRFDRHDLWSTYLQAYRAKFTDNASDKAIAYINIARLARYKLRDEQYAQELFQAAQDAAKHITHDIGKIDYYSHYYIFTEDWGKALHYNLKNLQLHQTYACWEYEIATRLNKLYLKLGMYPQAIDQLKMIINIEREYQQINHRKLSKLYNQVGEIYRQLGAYYKALDYYQQANNLILSERGEINFGTGSLANNIGETYFALGNYAKALTWHQKALNIRLQIKDHPYRTNSYDNLGITYLKLGQMKLAKTYLEKGLELRSQFLKTPQYERYYIKSYLHLAQWHQANHDLDEALSFYKKAITANISKTKEDQLAQYLAWNEIGMIRLARKDYQASLDAFNEAIQINMANGKSDLTTLATYSDPRALLYSLKGKAQVYQQLAQLQDAQKYYGLALQLLDKTRKEFSSQKDKLFMASQAQSIYQEATTLVYSLYQQTQNKAYLHQLFHISEQSKAGILLDAQHKQNLQNNGVLPDSLLELDQRFGSLISYYQQQINRATPDKVVNWKKLLFDAKQQQEDYHQQLKKHYPEYYHLNKETDYVGVAQIQNQLGNQETFLEFFEGKYQLFAFVISPTSFQVKTLPKLKIAAVQHFRSSIIDNMLNQRTQQYVQSANQLYTHLLEPLGKLEKGKLIIVPDGMLWHVNFDLLLTSYPASHDYRSFDYLMRQVAIRYAYSGSYLLNHRKKQYAEESLLAFAPSYKELNEQAEKLNQLGKFRGEVGILIHNTKEVEQISTQLNGDIFIGKEAIEHQFKSQQSSHSILHLAMHALVDNEDPSNSRLVFTHNEDSVEDNFLHVYELYNMKLPANLAVLSACNTGFGKLESGEGLMSLGRAFAYAGCPAVVMSQWKVDDLATATLMQSFYGKLAQGMSKSEALQAAKLDYLANCSPKEAMPFLWGSFVLMGDDEAIEVAESTNWMLISLISIFALACLTVVVRKFQ